MVLFIRTLSTFSYIFFINFPSKLSIDFDFIRLDWLFQSFSNAGISFYLTSVFNYSLQNTLHKHFFSSNNSISVVVSSSFHFLNPSKFSSFTIKACYLCFVEFRQDRHPPTLILAWLSIMFKSVEIL